MVRNNDEKFLKSIVYKNQRLQSFWLLTTQAYVFDVSHDATVTGNIAMIFTNAFSVRKSVLIPFLL